MSGRQWERCGAVAGLLFLVLFISTFFMPTTPDVTDTTTAIADQVAKDRSSLLLNVYLVGLASIFLLVFVAALWTRLRRAEPEPGASLVVLLGGVAVSLVTLVGNGATLSLIYAVDENHEPVALRALSDLDNNVFLGGAFAFIALFGGIALSAIPTKSLPPWLGWSAAVLALVFAVGLLGLLSEDDDGGALGILVFLGFLVSLLWVLAASIVMLVRTRAAAEPSLRREPSAMQA